MPQLNKTHSSFFFLSFILCLSLPFPGCGKSVDLSALANALEPGGAGPSNGNGTNSSAGVTSGAGGNPIANATSVDILFVVDTSCPMDVYDLQLAGLLPAFLRQLKPQSDFRFAVMLGHGGASPYSGRLFSGDDSGPNTPPVLSPAHLSLEDMEIGLEKRLIGPPKDLDEANGQALLYSLNRSLQPDRLAEIRSQGFYRNTAALAVIFMTNRSDLCYPPNLHGYSQFPDYVPLRGRDEKIAYLKYCVNPATRTPTITPASLYTSLTALQGQNPLALGGIIHVDPKLVPDNHYDSIGHGVLELVELDLSHVLLDFSSTDISPLLQLLPATIAPQH